MVVIIMKHYASFFLYMCGCQANSAETITFLLLGAAYAEQAEEGVGCEAAEHHSPPIVYKVSATPHTVTIGTFMCINIYSRGRPTALASIQCR